MLELTGKTLDIKFEDKVYTINYPRAKQMKLIPKDDDIEKFGKFFEALGLPREVFDELEVDHIVAITEAISKKKS